MQLTNYATYGIAVLQTLRATTEPVQVPRLAAGLGLSEVYMQQVIIRLRRAGLVASVRGPHGGYVLADRRRRVSVWQVIQATSRPRESTVPAGTAPGRIMQAVEAHLAKALQRLRVDDV